MSTAVVLIICRAFCSEVSASYYRTFITRQ